MRQRRKQKSHTRRAAPHNQPVQRRTQPFIEHAQELRRRLYYIGIAVFAGGCAVYSVQQHVVNILLRPAHGQHFIYTTPGGGIDFLFRVCIYGGLILATPVIVYNLLKFLGPLMNRASRTFIITMTLVCGTLALAGIVFGYFIGLPTALHFLLHQFATVQIRPLVTIQSYLAFVMAYMLGSALLFQLPIILICINRIKPLKPSRLLHYERWVILAAFVLAGLMNPTPNLVSQLLIAAPFIIMYQLGILIIALTNRPRKSEPTETGYSQSDSERQSLPEPVAEQPAPTAIAINAQQPVLAAASTSRRHRVVDVVSYQRRPIITEERANSINAAATNTKATVHPNSGKRFMDFIPPNTALSSEA